MKFDFSKITDYRLHNFPSIEVTVKFGIQRGLFFRKSTVCYVTVETDGNIVLLKQKVKANQSLEFLRGLNEALNSKHFKCLYFDWIYDDFNLKALQNDLGKKSFVFYRGDEALSKITDCIATWADSSQYKFVEKTSLCANNVEDVLLTGVLPQALKQGEVKVEVVCDDPSRGRVVYLRISSSLWDYELDLGFWALLDYEDFEFVKTTCDYKEKLKWAVTNFLNLYVEPFAFNYFKPIRASKISDFVAGKIDCLILEKA
jgi:hypothetical protein